MASCAGPPEKSLKPLNHISAASGIQKINLQENRRQKPVSLQINYRKIPKSDSHINELGIVHGRLILIIAVARLGWRLRNPPPVDVAMPAWQAKASHILHWAFYALMILIPLSGMAEWDKSIAGKHPEFANLNFINLFPIPHFSMSAFGSLHGSMTNAAMFLLLLHVAAALKHQFIDKDNMLKRMSPH